MERMVEERRVDGHRVVIMEDVTDEGSGFFLVVDGVPADEVEPLDRIPSDDDIRARMRMQGLQ